MCAQSPVGAGKNASARRRRGEEIIKLYTSLPITFSWLTFVDGGFASFIVTGTQSEKTGTRYRCRQRASSLAEPDAAEEVLLIFSLALTLRSRDLVLLCTRIPTTL